MKTGGWRRHEIVYSLDTGRLMGITLQCGVLGISASGYFAHIADTGPKASSGSGRRLSDEAVLVHIKAAHAGSKGEYGWPRIWKELLAKGVRIGKDRIQKLMKQHGIKVRSKRRYVVTTNSKHHLPIAANLLDRYFQPDRPNAVWTSDITHIPTDEGWLTKVTAQTVFTLAAYNLTRMATIFGWRLNSAQGKVRQEVAEGGRVNFNGLLDRYKIALRTQVSELRILSLPDHIETTVRRYPLRNRRFDFSGIVLPEMFDADEMAHISCTWLRGLPLVVACIGVAAFQSGT